MPQMTDEELNEITREAINEKLNEITKKLDEIEIIL